MDPLKAEFARLIAIMGWNKSEAGRQLGMTHAGINHILNPARSTRPRPTTLNLLKMMVAAEHPDALKVPEKGATYPVVDSSSLVMNDAPNPALDRASRELRDIAAQDPTRFDQVGAVITTYWKSLPKEKKSKTTANLKVDEHGLVMVKLVDQHVREDKHERKVPEPGAGKKQQRDGIGGNRSRPRADGELARGKPGKD